MTKSKIPGKRTKIPSPYGRTAQKTEWSATAVMMHWMREIIQKNNLDLGYPDVETIGKDRKKPDIVIYESRRSKNILCVIEAKPPYYDVFDEKQLKEPARVKAVKRRAKYFVTTNFKQLIWFNTEKVNANKPEEEQVVDKYPLSELQDLNSIEETRYRENIKRGLKAFLLKLYAVYSGKEPEPKQAIDELLVFRLHEKIERLSSYYRGLIEDQCHKESRFLKKLKRWFKEQQWSFAWQIHDFEKAARQTAYLLINKILFYEALQSKRPDKLDPLEIPESLTKASRLQKTLQGFFDEVLDIDYETIYTTDFIDTVAFPDSKEVVKEIKELIGILKKYDFSKLGYDIIGRIFERLIPAEERHNLGQYFTNPDVVDLILRFCIKHEKDKVLDPACGAGTFLVRAYQHKNLMNQRLLHEDTLATLWGNDIAKFPAHLSTINLAINDLSADKNYPNILQEDFFSLLSQQAGFELPKKWRMVRAKTLSLEEREVEYPRWFDCIVGNPPYTRQEEISKIAPRELEFKKDVIKSALLDIKGKKTATISKRAGIHAYFFVHGTKFLREGGYFGFIVSNSWLDVDYGKGLQEFFLKNYKIVAIIESKVERWFEEADINTCIVILQKCSDQKERKENLVRFVYLKKPLRHFIPPAQDMWEKQVERVNEIDKLIKTIMAHNEFYENEDLRIFPKSQKELWDEGFDTEEKKYLGAKWGKYLRAPQIFFKILEKGRVGAIHESPLLVPLKEVAEVRRGFTTGANEFFYLTEEEIKKKGIEKEFWKHKDEEGNWIPNYVIKSPRECRYVVVKPEDLKHRILMIHKDRKDLKGTNFGGGLLKIQTYEFQNIFVCHDEKYDSKINDAFMQLVSRPVDPIFAELGATTPEEISLDKVKPDRRELDKIIMGEILGLAEEEQLEVYRAVLDLVKSRIERAKSLKNRKKTKEGIDIDLLAKTVMEKIGEDTLGKFYKEKILGRKNLTSRSLPKTRGETKIEAGLFGWRLYSGRSHIDCSSELEARYLKVWSDIGLDRVKMPKDRGYLENIVSDFESIHKENDKIIESYLESIIGVKTQAKIRDLIWQEIMTSPP